MTNKNEFKKRVQIAKSKDEGPSPEKLQKDVEKVRNYVRKRTKDVIGRADREGALTRIRVLYAASHLLMSEANSLISEATDVATKYSIISGSLKKAHQKLMRDADDYFNLFSEKIDKHDVNDYFQNLEDFDKMYREWMQITEKDIEERITEYLEGKYGSKNKAND